jgi:hypothetical protein
MKRVRMALAAVVLLAAAASGFAVGHESGLDHFDNFLLGVRTAESDAEKQAALDAIRAKLADPKIDSRADNIAAFTAALKSASALYGSPEAFAAETGFPLASILAPMGIQLALAEARAQQVLVQKPQIGLILKLGKLASGYAKSQDVVKHPDLFKRLKSMAKYAKKFDAFAKKHGR